MFSALNTVHHESVQATERLVTVFYLEIEPGTEGVDPVVLNKLPIKPLILNPVQIRHGLLVWVKVFVKVKILWLIPFNI